MRRGSGRLLPERERRETARGAGGAAGAGPAAGAAFAAGARPAGRGRPVPAGEVAERVAAAGLDPKRPLPRHVAIVCDGNGRWARRRGLPRAEGHRAGVRSVRAVVRGCSELGIGVLTLYAFSTENWKRPADEVDALWELLLDVLGRELDELVRNNVRVRAIGRRGDLPLPVRAAVATAEEETAANTGLNLVLAINYGARQEIVGAARELASQAAAGRLDPAAIDADRFAACLETAGLPDPDLVVRPSGEVRLSNFLLWQSAYSEFVFTRVLWPDFGRRELIAAIREFQRRQRRFGGLGDAQ
jgi:undecaprenyl diphosphate synthase